MPLDHLASENHSVHTSTCCWGWLWVWMTDVGQISLLSVPLFFFPFTMYLFLNTSDHHSVHFKYLIFLFVNCTSRKSDKGKYYWFIFFFFVLCSTLHSGAQSLSTAQVVLRAENPHESLGIALHSGCIYSPHLFIYHLLRPAKLTEQGTCVHTITQVTAQVFIKVSMRNHLYLCWITYELSMMFLPLRHEHRNHPNLFPCFPIDPHSPGAHHSPACLYRNSHTGAVSTYLCGDQLHHLEYSLFCL